jgi:hypothetical protein
MPSHEDTTPSSKSFLRYLLIFSVPLVILFIWNNFFIPAKSEITSEANMSGRIAPLVFPAASRHTATVIFVHGLGDTGNGWASAVENWRRREKLSEVKFILPHAPEIPISVVSLIPVLGYARLTRTEHGNENAWVV